MSHRGSGKGYRSTIRRDLARRETVIMLTNMGGPGARIDLEEKIERILETAHPAKGG